ncbi:MAG: response regulator transcription factor [Chloroflexi bacterium]|nr:response regulator transcription factor [Chloroflexota bacterium]
MSNTILVADDEDSIVQLTKLYLSKEGYRVITARDGQEALESARRLKPDLIVLDLMMPRVDGWEVCRRLRKDSNVPVIMLTARDDDVDKIVGLELGADDYVTKPFNPRELVARVKAVLRRAQNPADPDATIDIADLHVDPARREVRVAGRPVQLRGQEFELLLVLAKQEGRVMTREALLREAWGYDYLGESRTVDVHVAWLRERLQGAGIEIQAVRGFGYKLVGTPRPVHDGTAGGEVTTAGRREPAR